MAGRGSWDPARPGAAGREFESAFTEDLAYQICGRVAAGESLSEVCRTPGLPERHTVLNWAMAMPDFGESLRAAARQARLGARAAELEIRELERRRRAARGGRRLGPRSTYTPQIAGVICARLAAGESLRAICGQPGMPAFSTVMKWARANLAFANAYAEARAECAQRLSDEAHALALSVTPATVAEARKRFNAIRNRAARLAPRKYVEVIEAGEGAEDDDDLLLSQAPSAVGEAG